jgi:hypothetical protein
MMSQFHGFAFFVSDADKSRFKQKDGGSYGMQNLEISQATQQKANIQSWKYFLGKEVDEDDIRYVIYGGDIDRYDSTTANYNWNATHPLMRRWRQKKNQDELEYIRFAQECETHCTKGETWDAERPSKSGTSASAKTLIEQGKAGYAASRKPFIQLRYAYQIVRLAHYQGQFQEAISLYEIYARPVLSASKEIGGWVTGNYAGCLRHEKRFAESAYAFSREYALSPSRRIDARWGWQINTDRQWQQLMRLCKNDREKADNHALRALSFYAEPHEDMIKMQQLDPGREDLDLILIHEIRNLEIELLGAVDFGSVPFETRLLDPNYKPQAHRRLRNIDEIVVDGLGKHQCFDSTLWQLAHVYLQFLDGEFAASSALLDATSPHLHGEDLLRAKKMELEMELVTTDHVTHEMETQLATASLRKHGWSKEQRFQFIDFRNNALFWKYMDDGNEAKATLMRNPWELLLRYGVRSSMIDSIFALDRKPQKTPLEKEMLRGLWEGKSVMSEWQRWDHDGMSRNELLYIKGTSLLVEGRLAQAIAVFEALPSSGSCGTDPFQPNIKLEDGLVSFWGRSEGCNKLNFAMRLNSLKQAIKKREGRTFHNYMQLGNASFNTLCAHPGSELVSYETESGWHYGYEKVFLKPYTIKGHTANLWPRNIDVRPAKQYYRLAIQATQDPDSQALGYYMIARCERMQNHWVTHIEEEKAIRSAEKSHVGGGRWDQYNAASLKYQPQETDLPTFAILRDRYADTWMVDYLIQECDDFRKYCAQ